MNNLVVCCDGTWSTAEQPSVTNVYRLFNALAGRDNGGNEQRRSYQPGVGTRGGPAGWLLGGIAGVGLSSDVMDAYRWLTTTYEDSDRIWLFGFSRGAYTVRSLAGMIKKCGLFKPGDQAAATIQHHVQRAYQHYRDQDASEKNLESFRRAAPEFSYDPKNAEDIPVHFIGVWDTVGSLGIPDNLGILNLGDKRERYQFHDVELNPHITHARHAVALDERRAAFSPTFWNNPRPGMKQVWFPGGHSDVGGGHPETGLSDGALAWMIEEAKGAGLAFDKNMVDEIKPKPDDVLHDNTRSALRPLAPLYDQVISPVLLHFMETRPRAVPQITQGNVNAGLVHKSALDRQQAKILTSPPYRPTRELANAGDSYTVTAYANKPWNDTGIYLTHGTYTFTATGIWRDAHITSGPEGTRTPKASLRLLGTALGATEKVFRTVFNNPAADFFGSRREEDLPWMSLVCVVANGENDGRHRRIAIHKSLQITVNNGEEGYLYAFANDAWAFYGNNGGSVELTVKRS